MSKVTIPKVTNDVEPMTSKEYFEMKARGNKLPLLDKPCSDCAITTGFYTPIADELLEEDRDLQNRALETWFCHNNRDCACRGARNYINSMNIKRSTNK